MIIPKKSLGQNFLIDKNVIKKIVSLTDNKNKNIIEIGPGTGNLTNEIVNCEPKKLILIEKDENLTKFLNEKYKKEKKIEILNDDILKIKLENKINKNTIVYGNLPYNISTQILVKFIKLKLWPPKFDKLIFMFQKEVAERILAKYNTSKYGRLKIITNWKLKVSDSFQVSKNCFFPKPKVDSTVLVFEPITNKNYKIKDINNLEKVTQVFFSKKRKMINKGFLELFDNSSNFITKFNLNLSLRPNQLKEDHYYKITEFYEKYKN
jgi:16S rRNA (adenine1518-N6/adenine1519-N6)-dimethyltransferase